MNLVHHVKRHYHTHYRSKFAERAHWVFLFDSALVAIILALLGTGMYFAFFYHPLRDDFKISIFTEKPLVGAEENALVVRVINGGQKRLEGAHIEVYLPKEFRLESTPAQYVPGRQDIEIGTMPAKISEEYRFRGFPVGPATTTHAYVRMSATAQDGESDERVASVELSWKENLVETSLSLPDSVISGQPLDMSISVKNGSRQPFEDVTIKPTWPENFRLTASTPPVRNGVASVGPLAAGETVTAEYGGRITGGAFDFDVPVDVYWTTPEGDKLLLSQTSRAGSAYSAGLKFETVIASGAPVLTPGDDVPVVIEYRNDGTTALKDLKFSLPLDAAVADAANSKVDFSAIPELKPGETGQVNGTIRLKKTFSKYVTNAKLSLTPIARFSAEGPAQGGAIVAGETVETKIIGQVSLLTNARYFTIEGDQIGRGPLPPRVGKRTSYWASAIVSTGSSALKDATVRIPLPADVSWTGKAAVSDGDQPVFENSAIVWHIGDLAAHAGATSPAPTASFELAITPTSTQIPHLTLQSDVSATDGWTGQSLTGSSPSVAAPTK